jgi:hypothetical protein
VCYEAASRGLCCVNRHYVCGDCLEPYAREWTDPDGQQSLLCTLGGLRCASYMCEKIYPVDQLAQTLSSTLFAAFLSSTIELPLRAKINAEFTERVAEEVHRRSQQSLLQHGVSFIIEECLAMSCPKCSMNWMPDDEFTECFALKCGNTTCNMQICGYCGAGFEKKRDADVEDECHQHVRQGTCSPYNKGLFPPNAVKSFARSFKFMRTQKIRAYLATVAAELGDQVIMAVIFQMRNVNLDPHEFWSWGAEAARMDRLHFQPASPPVEIDSDVGSDSEIEIDPPRQNRLFEIQPPRQNRL